MENQQGTNETLLYAKGIVHDVNNLLMRAIGYAQSAINVMDATGLDSKDLHKAMRATERAGGLVSQFPDFLEHVDQPRKNIAINGVVQEALDMVAASLSSPVKTHAHLDSPNDIVYADENQLFESLLNLLTNAVEAMKGKDGTLTIATREIPVELEGVEAMYLGLKPRDYICIEITDTGCGISPSLTERIFDPCYTSWEDRQGSGLGLYMARKIVANHGGNIVVESKEGAGSSFYVYLPIAQAAA